MEQHRKRIRLSSDAYNVGLGTSMKLTRRLCISTSAQYDKPGNSTGDVDTSTQDIADQYLFQLQESLEGNPSETQDRASEIVKSFVDLFKINVALMRHQSDDRCKNVLSKFDGVRT